MLSEKKSSIQKFLILICKRDRDRDRDVCVCETEREKEKSEADTKYLKETSSHPRTDQCISIYETEKWAK